MCRRKKDPSAAHCSGSHRIKDSSSSSSFFFQHWGEAGAASAQSWDDFFLPTTQSPPPSMLLLAICICIERGFNQPARFEAEEKSTQSLSLSTPPRPVGDLPMELEPSFQALKLRNNCIEFLKKQKKKFHFDNFEFWFFFFRGEKSRVIFPFFGVRKRIQNWHPSNSAEEEITFG